MEFEVMVFANTFIGGWWDRPPRTGEIPLTGIEREISHEELVQYGPKLLAMVAVFEPAEHVMFGLRLWPLPRGSFLGHLIPTHRARDREPPCASVPQASSARIGPALRHH
jgi:hypothetical protein